MFIKLNGFRIDYNTEGDRTGMPIILIHGFPFSKKMWKAQIDLLKTNYYVVSYDVRGHGLSDIGSGQYAIEYFVDDLFGLLDYLKLSRAVVVGFSMGGYIALRAIERNPERFQGLVLCGTRSEADNNESKIKRVTQAKTVKIYGIRKFADLFLQSVLCEKTYQKNYEIVKLLREIIEISPPTAIAGTLIALAARTDTTDVLKNIKVPTLIMVGEHDILTPPSDCMKMKDKIPNAQLQVIPDAAHMCSLENQEEFNRHLLNYLDSLKH